MKKLLSCLLALALTAALAAPMASAAGYTDVPAGSALAGEVQKAVDYGLMNGYSATKFGYSDSMTRAQFTAVLVRMMGWATVTSEKPSYQDVAADSPWYSVIETAAAHDVTGSGTHFRPNDPVTRAEMAELLVRALGLKSAAESLQSSQIPLSDAYANLHGTIPFTDLPEEGEEGYVAVAYAIGMTKGTSATTFSPGATATRSQAAAMLVRIYEKINQGTDFTHGFYAISSYSQLELGEQLDAVSAGWSRMTWDGAQAKLVTTRDGGNEYYVPDGCQEVAESLENLHLSVFMDGQSLKDMLSTADGRTEAMRQILQEVSVNYDGLGRNPYSGVTIDFEGLRSEQKADFTAFLKELKQELDRLDKELYVCVSPVLSSGYYNGGWYDGYDYGAIGQLADKVILLAYDYDARDMSDFVGGFYYQTAATAPIDQVYLGLKALTDQVDPSKVVLGFSCKNVAWQIDESGRLVSGKPVYPSTETVLKRLAQADTSRGWSEEYQQSYAVYTTEDSSRYFLWYQDAQSVEAALRTAKLLGVTGVSVWRLGTIPMDSEWTWAGLLSK